MTMAIKKKRWMMTILALLLLSQVQAQERTLTKYEYWIDNIETLFTSGNLNGQSQQTLQLAIAPEGCNEGLHHFYCRFQDSEGRWSTPLAWPFYVRELPQNEVVKVVKAEYWIDSNDKKELTVDGPQLAFTVDAAGEREGMHTLNYRLLNNEGRYSPLYSWIFVREKLRDESIDNKVALLEYWIDDISNGVKTIETDGNEINFTVDASGLSLGLHSLNYRVKDVVGRYSMPKTWMFLREELRDESIDNKVTAVEYWIDSADNGVTTENVNSEEINLSIDASALSYGAHTLVYRLKDAIGRYSTPKTWLFIKNKPAGNARITWYKYWWNNQEELAVREEVTAEGSEFVFNKQLTIPDYVMTNADEDNPTATLHVMFGDSEGHISKVLSTEISYTPIVFKIDPNELEVLKDFYAKFDGDNWTSKWVFAEGEPERTDFPGVTFGEPDELGYSHVVEIRMDKNNVKGDVTAFTLHLPQLTALYLYGNELRGDLTAFVSELTALKTLDVRANALSGLQAVPESVTTLEKGMQFRKDNAAECMEGLDPVLFYISGHQKMTLPSIITYDLASRSHKSTLLYMMERDNVYAQTYFGMLNPIATKEMTYATAWPQTPYTYEYGQDYELWLRTQDGTVYPAVIRYVMGDADMSGATDVLDVQTTITEILHPVLINLFNASAANTYTDDLLNVQDVVATVNIVLDNDTPSPASYRVRRLAYAPSATSNRLYVEGEKLYLNNENEVGAIEVTLRGVYADEVSLALSRKDYQLASRNTADGSRHILYSLSGKTIAAGTTALLRLAHGQAEPTDAILSSVDGKALDVMLDATPTAIEHAMTGNMAMRFDGNRLLVSSTETMDQVELSVVSAAGQRLIHIPAARLHAGLSIVDAPIPAGVYVVRIERDGKVEANVKLVKI